MIKVDNIQFNKSKKTSKKENKRTKGKSDQELKEKKIVESERAFREGVTTVRQLIAPSSMKIESDYLRLGQKYVRTLFIMTYPRYITLGWFVPIINLNSPLDISMYFYPVESANILKQLRKKVGVLEAEIISDHEKGAPRDPVKETALKDIEGLRDDLTQGIEKFFQFSVYITVYGDTLKELDQMSNKVESIIGSKLVFTKRALYQAEQGFNSTLPAGNDELMISSNMNSSPIAASFPFISSDLTSDEGVLYGINRHNNSLIIFDRFSLQNANTCVFATSGAGKSYAVKLEVLRSLMMGTEVIIIDPESEYKYLAEAVNGTFIDISLNSESKINPFDLPRGLAGNTRPADIIRSAIITIKGLLRIMLGEFTHQEDSLMDRAILETYAKKDIGPESDLSNIEPPVLSDLEQILSGMEGGEDLALRLKKYTEGTFAGLVNNQTNVDLDNQLVVFSVRDLEDELRPAGVYTIINYIWNVVRSKLKKRILVIDEAWWLMQRDDSAKFIYALVKRCRKYYLGVTTITQDVSDFLGNKYGRAIVTNSALQLLLRQSPASIDVVQKTFVLTEGEKYLLLESGVGTGIFFAGNKHVAIQIVASYAEDQIITSDPKQLLEIEEAKKEFAEEQAKNGNS